MTQSLLSDFNHHPFWRRSLSLWGYKYVAPSADRLLALYLHKIGIMGKKERTIFNRFIKPGMRVADIGANQGLYTLLFSQLVGPLGSVVAFEPEPLLFQTLSANCKANEVPNASLFNLALSNHEGTAYLHLSQFNSGDNRLNPSVGNGEGISVRLAKMDDVLENHCLDFIKIDVQGHELEVLSGIEKVLDSSPSLKIYFEYWPFGLRQASADPEALLSFFKNHGFTLYLTDSDIKETVEDIKSFTDLFKNQTYTMTGHSHTNLLAVRGKLEAHV